MQIEYNNGVYYNIATEPSDFDGWDILHVEAYMSNSLKIYARSSRTDIEAEYKAVYCNDELWERVKHWNRKLKWWCEQGDGENRTSETPHPEPSPRGHG